MDPDGYDRKAATAPPAGWNHDEKAALTNPAPPAYQDVPAAGYPQPGQGYPQPGQGYPQPGQGYPQPGQGYPQPGQGYPQQPQGYGNPPQYGGAPGQPYPAMPGQQYPPQPGATVTIQPTVYVSRPPLAHPVNDYMGYSIFTMLCCCLPLGIAALIYSISILILGASYLLPEMLPSLWRAVRPALSLRASTGLARAGHNPAAMPSPPPPHCLPAMFVQRCNMGTHPMKEEPLNSPQGAKDFIYSLQAAERTLLLRELHKFESVLIAQGQLVIAPPTRSQLKYVLLHNAIPFVGFGFLDNAIMIVAGTQIELSIGVILGISTMAAAALGNLVSDLAGLGLAGYVEALAYRLGMKIPDLSPKQADMWQTRVSAHSGKALGVGIGCILGMFPLFFFKDDEEKKKRAKEGKEETPTPATTTSSQN